MTINPAREAIDKIQAQRAAELPSTVDCIEAVRRAQARLSALGWQFVDPPTGEPGQFEVICAGFPGLYDARWEHCIGGWGWIVRDPYSIGAGQVWCWRKKEQIGGN